MSVYACPECWSTALADAERQQLADRGLVSRDSNEDIAYRLLPLACPHGGAS